MPILQERADYKRTWDALAEDITGAKIHVADTTDEKALEYATTVTLNALRATVGIHADDVCLEIGCGVGRVGLGLAPLVRSWIGCDVSGNMVEYTRERLASFSNIKVVETSGYDLQGIPDASVDMVYCTVVFMHLEEWDRYGYVKEAWRVLRPGGRFFCDNVNMMTDDGWALFEKIRLGYHPSRRPAHITKCSTPQELETYLRRAGFKRVATRTRHLWVDAWGEK